VPTVDQLVDGWIRHFGAADRDMEWRGAEQELSTPLLFGITLAGIVDAVGPDWFGEWKTMNPRYRKGWKEKWRFHPQSLTYGLLMRECGQHKRRFTVRVAFKSDPPSYDHEWWTYTDAELDAWWARLRTIAAGIRGLLPGKFFNPSACYAWGPSNPCEFLPGCTTQQWDVPLPGLVAREPWPPTAEVTHAAPPVHPDWIGADVLLDATRIMKYLECPEAYRRIYTRNEVEPPGEALRIGKEFHQRMDEYYSSLLRGGKETVAYG
jgi:hypothetical protein